MKNEVLVGLHKSAVLFQNIPPAAQPARRRRGEGRGTQIWDARRMRPPKYGQRRSRPGWLRRSVWAVYIMWFT